MEFAILTYGHHRNKRGVIKGEWIVCKIGSQNADVDGYGTLWEQDLSGPCLREGTIFDAEWSEVWVNTASPTPRKPHTLWEVAYHTETNSEGLSARVCHRPPLHKRLRAWGFVPVHEALENGSQ